MSASFWLMRFTGIVFHPCDNEQDIRLFSFSLKTNIQPLTLIYSIFSVMLNLYFII